MAETLQFSTVGDLAAIKTLDALPEAFRRRVLVSAARGGASQLRRAARANLQMDGSIRTGLLWKSINLRVKRYRNGIIWAGVGADKGVKGRDENGRNIIPANYIHLVENGTRSTKATSFLRRAADGSKGRIQKGITAAAEKGLAREIKKLNAATK